MSYMQEAIGRIDSVVPAWHLPGRKLLPLRVRVPIYIYIYLYMCMEHT